MNSPYGLSLEQGQLEWTCSWYVKRVTNSSTVLLTSDVGFFPATGLASEAAAVGNAAYSVALAKCRLFACHRPHMNKPVATFCLVRSMFFL
jgi:hypothetical protein